MWQKLYYTKRLLLENGNDMYKTSGRMDAVVHSFYLLPIHSLPSSLSRCCPLVLFTTFHLLSLPRLSCRPRPHSTASLASHPSLSLPPSLTPLQPPCLYATRVGRRRWLAASGTSLYLRTLFLALRPQWMTARLRRGRWG